ncbi:MAG: hypothetical protein M1827_006784 [Pycnora praestabilis]|nr:MAG: hypothetical protein M1827_006784 [Pycnora praestabilis]
MPTRSRSAAAAAPEVVEVEEPREGQPGLQFNEPLTWRAGKPIPLAELLRRLQALAQEMREMDQEEDERDSFTKVAKELAITNLIAHKDRGVRAWTACCLVDILRLCAPDAPYTGAQLRDIFTLLITTILPALSDPDNPYNSQHIYVLQSLASVKSIVLLTDIPSSEALILHLFTSFFDIMSGSTKSSSGAQIGKNVEHDMTAILVILVDESNSLPAEVVDIIVAQFLRADPKVLTAGSSKSRRNGVLPVLDEKQSTLLLKELPPAYNMAKLICNTCPEKMARHVSQYFNDVILDASASSADGATKHHSHRRASNDRQGSDDEEDMPSGPTEDDLKELGKAHRLLRELWRASPAVLQNVIPQLEAELSAENVQLRLLATETLGDIVSGIGAAGPPPPPAMDPSAYPPASFSASSETTSLHNVLTTPSSPQPFPQAHPGAYSNFLSRRRDKSALIRSAWTTGIGRILMTSAGGVGLSQNEEHTLVNDLASMLVDSDEKVRIAAVRVVGSFGFRDIVIKLGSEAGVNKAGSVLYNLAERARDRKHGVRIEGMRTLGRIWGVAAGAIGAGDEEVTSILRAAPSKIFDAYYANDKEIFVLLDHVCFELLLPLGYPPIKSKTSKMTNGDSQRMKDSQIIGDREDENNDADKIRTKRILLLIRDLDARAKKAFFAMQTRQVHIAKVMATFLKRCEEYNGGVMDENEADIKSHLTRLIKWFSDTLPDPARVSADLWKFAKMHDRRSYQLIRFCMAAESDYRTVQKAIKELTKRIEAAPGAPAGLLETLSPLLYRASLLVYNKSHVPAIVEFSRSDEDSLGSIAHEVLKEISTHTPEVFKAHVQELCKVLEDQAPTSKKPNEPGIVDTLKACAGFAKKFPKEIPKERKFLQSLINFALHGRPPASAKHAITILVAAGERKEMYAKDLVQRSIKKFEYGQDSFLARLATLSQLMLLSPKEVEDESDAVIDIAINRVLLKVRRPAKEGDSEWADDIEDECAAKMWALKILVNRLRSHTNEKTRGEIAEPVYKLLDTLIANEGELSKKKDTPPSHRSRLRLLAAQLYLKLCTQKPYDDLLTPSQFDRLATVSQDPDAHVRINFVNKVKNYLGQNKLPHRFYTIVFLLAYEPQEDFREETTTWVRSRSAFLAQQKSTMMESIFARFLSLLAHHPDYSSSADDLADFVKYILFYLQPVATSENLAVIYHIAQRVKQTRDAVRPEDSENLYYLSDLAQAVIRRYEDIHGWSMQTWPGRMGLPNGLFAKLPSHDVAQEIATKRFLPEELEGRLDALVRVKSKIKKASQFPCHSRRYKAKIPNQRKSDNHDDSLPSKKKSKSASTSSTTITSKSKNLPIRRPSSSSKSKTPKPAKKVRDVDAIPSSERRRSGRAAGKGKTYAEKDDEEDDEDMEKWNHIDASEDQKGEESASSEGECVRVNGSANGSAKPTGGEEIVADDDDDEDNDDDDGDLSDPPDSD